MGFQRTAVFHIGSKSSHLVPEEFTTRHSLISHSRENLTGWKITISLLLLSTLFYPLDAHGINNQLQRISAINRSHVTTQIAARTSAGTCFMTLAIFFNCTIYVLGRSPSETQIVSRLAWLYYNVVLAEFLVQTLPLGPQLIRMSKAAAPAVARVGGVGSTKTVMKCTGERRAERRQSRRHGRSLQSA
ncbi:hypothetical protein BDV12DRAFT_200900 [Aspergillus spectabilis]